MEDLKEFFKKFNIKPHSEELFDMAFTHSSFNSDAKTHHHDYERLEFIGDSVLGFEVASLLFKHHPEMMQGELTKARSQLVQTETLARLAKELGYYKYIKAGHSLANEEVIKNDSILEDVFESVIGALYLDQGLSFTRKFLDKIYLKLVIEFSMDDIKDYKSILQEAYQGEHRESVVYRVYKEKGPAHDKTFFVEVLYNNLVLGKGFGKSKKKAEQMAAKDALNKKAVI